MYDMYVFIMLCESKRDVLYAILGEGVKIAAEWKWVDNKDKQEEEGRGGERRRQSGKKDEGRSKRTGVGDGGESCLLSLSYTPGAWRERKEKRKRRER